MSVFINPMIGACVLDEQTNACKVDKETGCIMNNKYEACRQSFFLKQQNQILKSSTAPSQGNQELKNQIQELQLQLQNQRKEITTLKVQQIDSKFQQQGTVQGSNLINNVNPYFLMLSVLIIGLGVGYFFRKIVT